MESKRVKFEKPSRVACYCRVASDDQLTDGNLRVASYVRVGNHENSQASPFELQRRHYEEMIKTHDGWDFAGLYADEGAGTKTWPRPELERLLGDCRAGKIDLIVTKNISRLYRNTADAIATIQELRSLDPPVGIFFENERLNTLDAKTEPLLSLFRFNDTMAVEG